MKCIYCDEEKAAGLFSLEHIFPESLGGKLCDDFFKTRAVCRDCNSKAGLVIDGPFLKGALTKNVQAMSQMDFVDPHSSSSWAPFFYKGQVRNLELKEGEVCEKWEGAHGEHVYHVHLEDAPIYDTYTGGNPIQRKRHPGRAYLFLTDAQSGKVCFTIRSFELQFKGAQRYAGNFDVEIEDQTTVGRIPEEHRAEFRKIHTLAFSRSPLSMSMAVDTGAEEKFMAKIARAFGFQLFGESYRDSDYSKRLKLAMLERDGDRRRELVHYLTRAPNMQQVAKFIHVRGTYTIYFHAIETGFILGLVMPNGDGYFIILSDEQALWADSRFDPYRDGVAHVVAHGANMFIGPLSFAELHAHNSGVGEHSGLAELERRRFGVVKPVSFQFTSILGTNGGLVQGGTKDLSKS
ncbi:MULTISPECIES: HNH endonuclease [unclassified Duganella]|uniref:HNH endonuclease n=1 Tax=unclassified Duganella TaxID=2636909 RepID=UPI0008886DB7|nr:MULTISPECIES: HNH endonuclease [unclassified Duganella]SDF37904.1 HNH endonuclease [Duganella sp. OV458]SDI88454.1 HNH endonuclease [Duganella sp. OV510]